MNNGMEIMLITIKIHPMIVMELQIDLMELFEPDDFLERIQCIAIEQKNGHYTAHRTVVRSVSSY